MARCANHGWLPIDLEVAAATRREQALPGAPLRFIQTEHLRALRVQLRALQAASDL